MLIRDFEEIRTWENMNAQRGARGFRFLGRVEYQLKILSLYSEKRKPHPELGAAVRN
jgi:hypothetical protein